MPSLPVNNVALSSQEDSYRRYFGGLKTSSPTNPRCLLCTSLVKICVYALLLSGPPLTMLYLAVIQTQFYEAHHFYLLYCTTQFIITFFWCLCVIYVIFMHQYANFKWMTLNAFIISLISFAIASALSDLCHNSHDNKGLILMPSIWQQHYWRVDIMYFCIFRLPFTLYFSILVMYYIQYRHCCANMLSCLWPSDPAAQNQRIHVPNYYAENEVEVFEECVSNISGTEHGGDRDDDLELSLLPIVERHDSFLVQSISFEQLESAARAVVTKHMLRYCALCMVSLWVWFVVLSTDPNKYDDYRYVWYCILFVVYHISKALLKRSARTIDTAIIVANFPFEIVTEIVVSAFYWIQLRLFTVRYQFVDHHHYLTMCIIGFIHLSSEMFSGSIRMSSLYFKRTGKTRQKKKSTFTQWKVRGAVDTAVRFIISVYSILFVSVCYIILLQKRQWTSVHNSMMFNYSVFTVELVYFALVLFCPGCAGKISQQKQINMAEPLMRIYNANRKLFLGIFCVTLSMSSLFVFV
eukprot:63331_1